MTKICTKCKIEKLISAFHKDSHKSDGLCCSCKGCQYRTVLAYRNTERGKQRHKKSNIKYAQTEHGKRVLKNYRLTPAGRLGTQNSRYKRKYGITIDQYNEMLTKQNGVCAICGNPESRLMAGTAYLLAIDHNHVTGKVRGLLCNSCNRALGLLNVDSKDGLDVLCNIISYIKNND